MDLLGKTGSWFRRRRRTTPNSWACTSSARSKPHGADVYWRPLRRFSVCGAAQSWVCESVHFPAPRRWIAVKGRVHQRDMPLRTARQYAATARNLELPRLSRARNGNFETKSCPGPGKDSLGCVPRNLEARRRDCVAHTLQIRARHGSRSGQRLAALVRRLSSEPAEYPDGTRDVWDVRRRPAAGPFLPRKVA